VAGLFNLEDIQYIQKHISVVCKLNKNHQHRIYRATDKLHGGARIHHSVSHSHTASRVHFAIAAFSVRAWVVKEITVEPSKSLLRDFIVNGRRVNRIKNN